MHWLFPGLMVFTFAIFDANPANAIEPLPRVIAIWADGPFEVRAAFTGPVDSGAIQGLVGSSIRFDSGRPIRSAKTTGSEAERGSLHIVAARLEGDARTLILTTDPHPRAATYAIDFPVAPLKKELTLEYDLTGIEVTWDKGGEGTTPEWTGWWPTFDPALIKPRLGGSTGHEHELDSLTKPGRLNFTTLLTIPKGPAVVRIAADAPIEATLNGEAPEPVESAKPTATLSASIFKLESTGDPLLLNATLKTGENKQLPKIHVSISSNGGQESEVTTEQLILPWVPASPPPPAPLEGIPDLSGGDPKKGAQVFVSGEAKCSSCHKVRGVGGNVGPDLSSLVGHDIKDVYREIAVPSARIHPDYVPYTIALKGGRILVGTVRAEGASAIRVSDTEAKSTVVNRSEIEEFRPSATSIMPVGLGGAIGEAKMRDLIAFLTSAP